MRVISKSRLRKFQERLEFRDSETPLLAWYTHVSNKSIAWRNWADVKVSFGNADFFGNCVIFNIGGNKYRLVARILYPSQKVFILKVMSHKEYDKGNWKDQCGCRSNPPKTGTREALGKTSTSQKEVPTLRKLKRK
jgi:mRNA interferase HigB